MPKIIAIITEYNPFHNGHEYQINKIREENDDAVIIAIMSGNIVQRGEFAILDKYARAEMATKCGADMVLELPYPYSGSTAELFAYGGVKLVSDLGADVLYFGTETENIEELEKIAFAVDSEEFEREIKALSNRKEISYPELKEKVIKNMGYDLPKGSNDILAIEYIRQIRNNQYNLQYKSIKRIGAGYKDNSTSKYMSASGIRQAYIDSNKFLSMPKDAITIAERERSIGKVLNYNHVARLLYYHVIFTHPQKIEKSFDCLVGMGYFISQKAREAKNPLDFFESLNSKRFTTARLKRTILYSFFNVSSIRKTTKSFTILLAVNEKGKKFLKNRKNNKRLIIITKHSDSKKLDKNSYKMYEQLKKVDEIYQTVLNVPDSIENAYKFKPIVV